MALEGTATPASPWAIQREVVADLAKSVAAHVPGFRRWRAMRPRSAPGDITDEWLQRNAFVTLDFVTATGFSVANCDIAEIGVGDSVASGLAFLAAGARSYTAADPYLGDLRSLRNREIYRRVREAWISGRHQPWPEAVDVRRFPNDSVAAVRSPIEQMDGVDAFDLICSVSVVEHVWQVDEFAASMRRLLRPAGVALHWIDLGPHGNWARFEDKLTFLRVPEPLWRTGRSRGLPTRLRLNELIAAFRDADLDVEVAKTGRLTQAELPPSSARFARRFRAMTDDDLATTGALLTLKRKT